MKENIKEPITTVIGLILMALVAFKLISPDDQAAVSQATSGVLNGWTGDNLAYNIGSVVQAIAGVVMVFAAKFHKPTTTPVTPA